MNLATRMHVDGVTTRLWVLALLVFASVTTLILLSVGVAVLLQNSQQAKASRVGQEKALRLLIECTTPPTQRKPPEAHPRADDCYVRSQASTTALIAPNGPLSPLLAAAAACGAAHPGDIPGTRDCVLRGLRQ